MSASSLFCLYLFFSGIACGNCIAKRRAHGLGMVFYSLGGGFFMFCIVLIALACVGGTCTAWEYFQ